jgi:serine/threonine-protein kinase
VSSSNPAVPEPTEIAGRYQIVLKLGAGAFGTVYKARDTRLDRMVAIKTIRLEGLAASQAGLKEMLDRFDREARTAAGLKNPGIVTIHDFGEAQGLSFIVMELVDGVGLDRVIAKSGKMSVERAAAIGAQVADALGYAHKHGIVHRDVKPANIMLEPGDRVKVTDFGIAKPADSADNLTMTGSLLGTPSYMSPEQARAQKLDGRSDLFSLGCILYEMLAGQKAFRGDSVTAIIFKIITEEPPPLRELDPTVPDEMLRIIAKALAKAPEKRYQSGRELADDLIAITRPGFVPTVRAQEVPTLPPDASPGDVPTIASPPTARPEVTIGSAATAARPATPSARPAPAGGPPPLPPTILTPQTGRVAAPPAAARPASRAPQPLVAPSPTRRKGAGAGLLVGLGLAAVLGLAVVVGGAWYLFGRTARTTETSAAPDTARVAETRAPAEAASVEPTTTTVESAPGPATAPPAAVPGPTPAPASARVGGVPRPQPPPTTPPVPPPSAADSVPAGGAAGGGEYAYLDELPPETPDGRAAGEALAQKYRSGGSSGYTSTRFRARPLFPPGTTLLERPAVGTLLHLHQAEEAFHRKNGRYGSPRELAEAGFLRLDVPVSAEGFRRARYVFRVTAGADAYRADAVPFGASARAFMVDDSGYVRLPD